MTTTDILVPAREIDEFRRDGAITGAALDSFHAGVIAELRQRAGKVESWHESVLRAMGQWSLTHETVNDRDWQYVIGGEALDGLTLAQRLCMEIPDVVPEYELESLLFLGRWPEPITPDQIRYLIGPYRYAALLNFRYGIVVEEALQLVAEESIRKSRLARCYQDSDNVIEDAYRHLYGDTQTNLIAEFRGERPTACEDDSDTLALHEWQEFTYWLFKRRVRKWHPARVASDTRRGLQRLSELHDSDEYEGTHSFVGGEYEPPPMLMGRP